MNDLILKFKKFKDKRDNVEKLNIVEYKKLVELDGKFKVEKIETENTGVGVKVVIHYKDKNILKRKDISDYDSW